MNANIDWVTCTESEKRKENYIFYIYTFSILDHHGPSLKVTYEYKISRTLIRTRKWPCQMLLQIAASPPIRCMINTVGTQAWDDVFLLNQNSVGPRANKKTALISLILARNSNFPHLSQLAISELCTSKPFSTLSYLWSPNNARQ